MVFIHLYVDDLKVPTILSRHFEKAGISRLCIRRVISGKAVNADIYIRRCLPKLVNFIQTYRVLVDILLISSQEWSRQQNIFRDDNSPNERIWEAQNGKGNATKRKIGTYPLNSFLWNKFKYFNYSF